MADEPFSNPEINKQINAKLLRLDAASLQFDANSDGHSLQDYDDHFVRTLVESLDAHADAYLCRVDREYLINQYVAYIREVGSKLVSYQEQRGFLLNPYSDDRLRKIAESSGRFIVRKRWVTPAQHETEILDEVERLRIEVRNDAVESLQRRSQIRSRIESLFEARYRCWEATAIERVFDRTPPHTSGTALSRWLQETEVGPQKWADIEISFFNDLSVAIKVCGRSENWEVGALGMTHKRNGKPTRAWHTLHTLAQLNGVISSSTWKDRNWATVEKRMQELRRWLRTTFGLVSNPLPFIKGTGYRAEFTIGCAASYQP